MRKCGYCGNKMEAHQQLDIFSKQPTNAPIIHMCDHCGSWEEEEEENQHENVQQTQ